MYALMSTHTHFMTPIRRTIYGQKVKKNRVCILPVCPLCHLALCKKFHHVSAIPPICESVWVCMWMSRRDKVCKCIQAFPAASAAVIRYWFIVTVAMATPDWNTNPTETMRTWNHIAQPSDDWQALFPWVMARGEVRQQRINATEVHSNAFFCQVSSYLLTDLIEVPGSNHCNAKLLGKHKRF